MTTQIELKQKWREATDRLKLALHYADTYLEKPVSSETISSLDRTTREAAAAVNALRSAATGNDEPKVGG